MQNKDDFKYVLQDMGHVYFGRELTYQEMMDLEDVPFKWKAIIGSYISKDVDHLNISMLQHLLEMDESCFSFKIFEQLKLEVKFFYKEELTQKNGKIKERYVHKSVGYSKFIKEYEPQIFVEEFSISKLALMMISI